MMIPFEQKRNLILRYGINIPTRYEVRFSLPLGAQSNELFRAMIDENIFNSQLRLSIACESTDKPGRLIQTSEHKISVIDRKMPFGVMYEDVQMTFRLSEDFFERKFFEAWQTLIFNQRTREFNYYDDYVVDIDIFEFDTTHKNIVHGMKLKEAFPFSIFPLVNQEDATGTYQKQTIAFKYKEVRLLDITDNIGNIIYEEQVSVFPQFESIIRNILPLDRI